MPLLLERIQPSDLVDLTYEALRKRILRRELATGEQIPVDLVASQLGVSRTPVIDALKRLESDGLVEIKARRGCFVRSLTVRDVHEIFDVREAVERFGVRCAIEGAREAVLPKLRAAIAQMERSTAGSAFTDYENFIEWDRAFHLAIVGVRDNSRMLDLYNRLNVHLHIMRAHIFRELEPADHVNADHAQILSAVAEGDAAKAEEAVSLHLRNIRERIVSNLDRGGGFI